MTRFLTILLTFAAAESLYATFAALVTHTDPYPSLVAAVVFLGAWFLVRHGVVEHRRARADWEAGR